jgi:uncharacterized protein HemY
VKVWLVILGVALVALGLAWPWIERLGQVPGDFRIEREGFSFYFPLTTSIIASLVASLIVWLLRR